MQSTERSLRSRLPPTLAEDLPLDLEDGDEDAERSISALMSMVARASSSTSSSPPSPSIARMTRSNSKKSLPKIRKSTKHEEEEKKKKKTTTTKIPSRTPWDWIEDIYCSREETTSSLRVNDIVEVERDDTLFKGTIVAVIPVSSCHEIQSENATHLIRVRYEDSKEEEWIEDDSSRIHKSEDLEKKKELLASPLRQPLALAKQMSRLGVSSKVGNESRLRTCVTNQLKHQTQTQNIKPKKQVPYKTNSERTIEHNPLFSATCGMLTNNSMHFDFFNNALKVQRNRLLSAVLPSANPSFPHPKNSFRNSKTQSSTVLELASHFGRNTKQELSQSIRHQIDGFFLQIKGIMRCV